MVRKVYIIIISTLKCPDNQAPDIKCLTVVIYVLDINWYKKQNQLRIFCIYCFGSSKCYKI